MSKSLLHFSKGEKGKIIQTQNESLRIALLGMGIGKNTLFQISNIAPLGGPIGVLILGTKIAIRREDASKIEAEPIA